MRPPLVALTAALLAAPTAALADPPRPPAPPATLTPLGSAAALRAERPAPTDQASSPWLVFTLHPSSAAQMSRSRSHSSGMEGRDGTLMRAR